MTALEQIIAKIESVGFTVPESERIARLYIDEKIVKIDKVSGGWNLSHGDFFDKDVLNRAKLAAIVLDYFPGLKLDKIEYRMYGKYLRAQIHLPAGIPDYILRVWSDAALFIDYDGYLTLSIINGSNPKGGSNESYI